LTKLHVFLYSAPPNEGPLTTANLAKNCPPIRTNPIVSSAPAKPLTLIYQGHPRKAVQQNAGKPAADMRSIIVPHSSLMKNSQSKYPTSTTTRTTPVVSEAQDIGHLDPLRLAPTDEKAEDCAEENEEHLEEVDVKWEEYLDDFEDIVEEEVFKMEDEEEDNHVDAKDLSEKEPIFVLNQLDQ